MAAFKKTINGPGGIKLVLDHGDAATPAMVYNLTETASSTYDCAVNEGILSHPRAGDTALSAAQIEWLEKQINAVERAYDTARKDNPEYK